MDIVDAPTRSRMMASVRQRDTEPEMLLRRAVHRLGLRFKLHDKGLPGRPDLVFPRFHAVVFVHGCYWHAHTCRYGTTPSTRREFWTAKFAANRARDARTVDRLLKSGWRTLVVWECAMKPASPELAARTAEAVRDWLLGGSNCDEIDSTGLRAPGAERETIEPDPDATPDVRSPLSPTP